MYIDKLYEEKRIDIFSDNFAIAQQSQQAFLDEAADKLQSKFFETEEEEKKVLNEWNDRFNHYVNLIVNQDAPWTFLEEDELFMKYVDEDDD